MARRPYLLYVGVDIAAATFDAAWQTPDGDPSPARTFQQTPADLARVQQVLQATGVAPDATLVVLEATGSYGARRQLACRWLHRQRR